MNTYDEMPYEGHAYAQTHPSRLAVVATLFGLDPPPVETCRVLELGCASGGNLIPMAEGLPNATYLNWPAVAPLVLMLTLAKVLQSLTA